MGTLFASLLAMLAVEFIFRARVVCRTRALGRIARKSFRVVRSRRISDHWKEIVLLRYASELAARTAGVAIALAGCGAVVVLPALLLDQLFRPDPSTLRSLASLSGVGAMTVSAVLYALLRKRLAAV